MARLEELTESPKQDIVDGPFGSNLKASEYVDTGIPIVRLQNIDRNRFLEKNIRCVTSSKADELSRHSFQSGDVIITKLGDPVGKACIVPSSLQRGIIVADVVRARLDKRKALKEFITYAINSPEVVSQLNMEVKGSTRPRVNLSHIRNLEVPLPPLNEQRRIVAKLEELLARVDASQQRLAKIPVIIKRFRQAVLAAACSGRLTADWREEQDVTLPLAPSHQGRGEKKKGDDAASLSPSPQVGEGRGEGEDLPEGWQHSDISPLLSTTRKGLKTGPFGSMLKKHEHQQCGIPVLGIENIGYMKFIPGSKIHVTVEKAKQLKEFDARPGDVLISRSGTVGEVCVVPEEVEEARISTNIMRVVLSTNRMLPTFFCYLFNGDPNVLEQVAELCKGSTRDFLNQTILKEISFPLPPLPEQQEIVRRVETLFTLADQLEARYLTAKTQVDKLTQSILAKAFRGELVPQNPSDEPATVLLERIRAEQAAKPEVRKNSVAKRRIAPQKRIKKPADAAPLPLVAEEPVGYAGKK